MVKIVPVDTQRVREHPLYKEDRRMAEENEARETLNRVAESEEDMIVHDGGWLKEEMPMLSATQSTIGIEQPEGKDDPLFDAPYEPHDWLDVE